MPFVRRPRHSYCIIRSRRSEEAGHPQSCCESQASSTPLARFYSKHGLIQEDLFGFVPELTMPDGARDVAAARLLLELANAKGPEWMALQWLQGGLDTLFTRAPLLTSKWGRLGQFYLVGAAHAQAGIPTREIWLSAPRVADERVEVTPSHL